ncbi:hypothetical protein D3C86_1741930 [compost metagenome]
MPRRFRPHFLVGRILRMAARIPGYHRDNSRQLVKRLDHTPKAAARKGGKFRSVLFVQPEHLLCELSLELAFGALTTVFLLFLHHPNSS